MKTIYKKQQINIIKGDLFDNIEKIVTAGNNGSSVIVPHVCNNIDLFGAGFAAETAKHYPIVKENYHLLGKSFLQNNLGYVQFVEVLNDKKYGHKLVFANMIAQNGILNKLSNPRPLNYLALTNSMLLISRYISQNFMQFTEQNVQIHSPKFGSGLAGGNWHFIKDLIDDIWNKYQVVIYDHK